MQLNQTKGGVLRFKYSFICQGTLTGTFSVFESSCHLLLLVNHSEVEAITLSTLPKDTTSELAGISPH